MPVPLVALMAAAIYESRSQLGDLDSMNRALSLLASAKGNERLSLEVGETDLLVNGVPLSPAAPGSAIIRQALIDHDTLRLILPADTSIAQLREIVEMYASAPGLYASIDDLRDALRSTVPDVVVSGSAGPAAEGDLRDALFELPGLRATSSNVEQAVRPPDPHAPGLAGLAARLDPVLQSAAEARDSHDYGRLAQILAQLNELENGKNEELDALVARERRRVVPPAVLESMARSIPKQGSSAMIARVLGSLGREGAEALFNALVGAPGPHERRAYIAALVDGRDCVDSIVEVLGSPVSRVLREAAEIAGRRRLERAVPELTHLLRHTDVEVRTAAWHALELIGTPAAIRALRS
jgi:hypothetical protein